MKQHCLKYHLSFHSLSLPFTPFHSLFLFFSLFTSVSAQSTDFTVHRQQRIILPHHVGSVFYLDSDFYCYASGVLMKAQRNGSGFLYFRPDTSLVRLNADINYIVRHPSTGDLYFTTNDDKGRSYLYCCHVDENGKQKVKQVKMDGGFLSKGMYVYHPTFTADGEVMVFSSSKEDFHRGSLDLWYSQYNGEEWSDPVNLGRRINTTGNEISPFIYHECLLFASNGEPSDNGRYTLYATRLFSDSTGHRRIGRCLVQRLPEPFNIAGTDNLGLSFDPVADCGFWISNRDDVSGRQLYSCPGHLEGMLLWGTITDRYDHPLAGVKIAALQEGATVCSATSDARGRYSLFLQCGQQYDLSYRLDNFFVTTEPMYVLQGEEGYLITEQQHNIKLHGLPVGQRFYYDDLFGPDADVELSNHGKEVLKPLVQFLTDNPTKRVTLSLANDLTDDPSFNSLLTESRIRSLEKYLQEALPKTVEFNIFNSCDGKVKCSSGTGLSTLTILIDN